MLSQTSKPIVTIVGSGHGMVPDMTDTICIPRKDAVKLLTKAEEGKLLAEKVTHLDNHITLLNSRIIELEGIGRAYELTEGLKDSLINSYKAEIEVMKDQRKIFETEIARLNKEIRRYKRKLFWRTAGGATLLAAATYFYLTK